MIPIHYRSEPNKKALCSYLHRAFSKYNLLLCYVFFYCIHEYTLMPILTKVFFKYTKYL